MLFFSLVIWFWVLFLVVSSRIGMFSCLCRLWVRENLFLFGIIMFNMIRLKFSLDNSCCVWVVLCVVVIRKLLCIRKWCSRLWICLLLLIIRIWVEGVFCWVIRVGLCFLMFCIGVMYYGLLLF